jgi:hypothetical protein
LYMIVPVASIPGGRVACMVRDRMYGMGQELCYLASE